MTAVERARQALADLEGTVLWDQPTTRLLRDLLAEHDAGVWLDTRELAALGSVDLALNNARSERHSPLWRVTQFSEPGGSWVAMTARDAVRAAREATGE